jgi:molybdopterin synthase sulfur carrier subunit
VADETARSVHITVRYFGAALAATGADAEQMAIRSGASVDDLIDSLARRGPTLARVLLRCSLLCDGVAVRDRAQLLRAGNTVDVLPPFAGG